MCWTASHKIGEAFLDKSKVSPALTQELASSGCVIVCEKNGCKRTSRSTIG
jgi:hypothetical protein